MKTKILTIVVLLSAFIIISGFSCSVSTSILEDIKTSTSVDPETKAPLNPTASFSKDTEVIYITALLKNAPSDTIIIGSASKDGEAIIEPATISTEGTRYVAFSIPRPATGFEKGTYTAIIKIQDQDKQVQTTFNVE